MLAATAFVRSQAILIGVPVVILLLADLNLKSLVRVGIALGVGVAILIVPWAARNEAAMGRPYLINDNLAYNLRIAHAPNSTGTSVPPQDLWDERPGISFKERELFFDEAGGKRALAYARAHPKRELELAVYRVGYLVRSDSADAIWESLRVRPNGGRASLYLLLGDLFYYPLVALAALSVLLLKPSRLCVALWSSILVWIGLHLVFAGEPRYHVPLMPVAAVLAAGAVGSFISRISARMLD